MIELLKCCGQEISQIIEYQYILDPSRKARKFIHHKKFLYPKNKLKCLHNQSKNIGSI